MFDEVEIEKGEKLAVIKRKVKKPVVARNGGCPVVVAQDKQSKKHHRSESIVLGPVYSGNACRN